MAVYYRSLPEDASCLSSPCGLGVEAGGGRVTGEEDVGCRVAGSTSPAVKSKDESRGIEGVGPSTKEIGFAGGLRCIRFPDKEDELRLTISPEMVGRVANDTA